MAKNYICGLDIGGSKIAACVAEVKRGKVVDIFFEAQESRGVKKGSVVDAVDLAECVGKTLKAFKTKFDIKIKAVHTNISGQDVSVKHSRAIIPLAERGNKVITALDIENVNRQAFILGSVIDEEVVHQIPYSYSVDNKTGIANPLGLVGHKLEVDLYLICAKLSSIQTINYVINQAGFDAREIFLSGLAASEVIFDESMKKGGSILCDIGSDFTELSYFKDGVLRDVKMLFTGGNDLTQALQEGLNISLEQAKEVKVSSGLMDESQILDENNQILVRKDAEYKPIKKKQITDILNARSKSICLQLKDEVEKLGKPKEINHFVLTGGVILQDGFLEMLEANMGIPVEFARIRDTQMSPGISKNPALSGRKYMAYATALGLICKELYGYNPKTLTNIKPIHNPILKTLNRLKGIYSEYF